MSFSKKAGPVIGKMLLDDKMTFDNIVWVSYPTLPNIFFLGGGERKRGGGALEKHCKVMCGGTHL